ncbi:MAG TPA: response regulator transcription factor [Terracidiphilus sp.]|jgi:DNA-binding response OmpR family regulator|nr:response regulator transcription factor [Terracidiphilus sp.]
MGSLLIIDDDVDLCGMLQTYLFGHGLQLAVQHDALAGLRAAIDGSYDLVILDVMLPFFDGFSLLRKLRTASQIGVIMLTARANDQDRIQGFDAGADDYVPKPFNPRELLARIQAILRRSGLAGASAGPTELTATFAGVLRLNISTREAVYREQTWHLTETEFLLLSVFLESPGIVIHREDLVAKVFQREFHPFDRSLDMHISRLRKKLDTMGCPPDWIKTIRNSGYLFSDQS